LVIRIMGKRLLCSERVSFGIAEKPHARQWPMRSGALSLENERGRGQRLIAASGKPFG
jgi:hypothetical protein